MVNPRIISCPHCGNRTEQAILYHIKSDESFETDEGEIFTIDRNILLVQCGTCSRVSLLENWGFEEDYADLVNSLFLYPTKRDLTHAVPDLIRESYEEAKKVQKSSTLAFAVLIRRALEYLCRDQGATQGNLKTKIEYLGCNGVIPEKLSEMADAIRLLGNISAHARDFEITPYEAKLLDDFYIAMIEYVYIAPHRLDEIKSRLDKQK